MILISITFIALLMSSGCQSMTKATTGKENYPMQVVPVPNQSVKLSDPKKCRVYLIRKTNVGWGYIVEIFDNDMFIGNIHANAYLCWEREPGKMLLTTETAGIQINFTKQKLPVDVQAGNVYYIEQTMWFGGKLKLLSEEKGRKLLEKCSLASISNPQQTDKI